MADAAPELPATRPCPDCQSEMTQIALYDKTHGNGQHKPIDYGPPGGQRSFFFGKYPVDGTLAGYICGHCQRVVLYGIPKID